MRHVIILGDIQDSSPTNLWSRYLGPHPIASYAESQVDDVQVTVIDYFLKIPNFFDYLADFLSPDTCIIGISTTFLTRWNDPNFSYFNLWLDSATELDDWLSELKALCHGRGADPKIVIGGHLCDHIVQSTKELPKAYKNIDHIISGYAEGIFKELLESSKSFPQKIIVEDKAKTAIVCETIFKEKNAIQRGEWLPIEIAKGCNFGCNFCFYDTNNSKMKNVETIKQEFLRNYEKYGITGYHFSDDTINDSPQKVNIIYEIATSLPFQLEWVSYARPDMFVRFPEMGQQLIESGARGLFLGIESLNPIARKVSGKSSAPEKIVSALENFSRISEGRCSLTASFIIGLPEETTASLDDTLTWLKEQSVLDSIQHEALYISSPDRVKASEFTKNSPLYGFRKLQWKPFYYWEHDTLNYLQCREIGKKWESELKDHRTTVVTSHHNENANFWSYPRIRSLGFDHAESIQYLKGKSHKIVQSIKLREQNWLKQYFHDLRDMNYRSI